MYVSAYWPFSTTYRLQDVLCVDYMYINRSIGQNLAHLVFHYHMIKINIQTM